MQGFQKQSFVLTAHSCFKNVGITGMCIMAGFHMLFDRGVNIFIGSGLVNVNGHVLQVTLYTCRGKQKKLEILRKANTSLEPMQMSTLRSNINLPWRGEKKSGNHFQCQFQDEPGNFCLDQTEVL